MRVIYCVICLLPMMLFPLPILEASPDSIAVIVSKDSPETGISRGDLKRIYKGEMAHWKSGQKVTAVNYKSDLPIRAQFYRRVLNASPTQKFYPGGPLPFRTIEQRSVPAMKRFVASLPNAVGYIYTKELDHTVKVLLTIE